MKYLIIGLGNAGPEYENTRHNIGFKVLDKVVNLSGNSFANDRHADIAEVKFKGRNLVLIKPNTFMNLSGKAVNYWLQKTKINRDNMLVITDDISLPFGVLRMRKKGSDGGHNGLKDIQSALGFSDYSRLRFGIGNNFKIGRQSDYVLSPWESSENEVFLSSIDSSISIIESFCAQGIEYTMNNFNGK